MPGVDAQAKQTAFVLNEQAYVIVSGVQVGLQIHHHAAVVIAVARLLEGHLLIVDRQFFQAIVGVQMVERSMEPAHVECGSHIHPCLPRLGIQQLRELLELAAFTVECSFEKHGPHADEPRAYNGVCQ